MTDSSPRPLGLVPKVSDISTDSGLRKYKLKAGRMASRKIPLLPKFGHSPISPYRLPVSPPITLDSPIDNKTTPQPFSPKQRRGPMTVPITTHGSSWHSSPHISDPCTFNDLSHILSCGHKIITLSATPEPCSSNCFIRLPPDLEQPRNISEAFTCTACIVEHLAQRHSTRCEAYVSELKVRLESANVERGSEWIGEKLGFVELAWRDEDVEEVRRLNGQGKGCVAPWIEPEFKEVVDLACEKRQQRVGRRGSRETITTAAESTRPLSPTPSVVSVASRTPSMFSWHGGLPFGR